MNVQRTNQSMVKLLDGRVLAISGSQGNFDNETPTCEIYDPESGQWTLTGSVSNPTFPSTAVLLNDGRVLKVGNAPGGASTVTEIYDPNAGSWSTTSSLITPIYQANLVKLSDGRVLKIGGDQWGNLIMESEIYDPATGQWTQTGSLNYARSGDAEILLPDGRVLVAGGSDLSGNFILPSEIYDPATGQWSVDASLNTGHQLAYMATLSNGKVLIVSGNQKTTEVYSPISNLAPQVGAISVSSNPVQINTSLTASATFTDANTGDTHTASWDWGDGSTKGTVTENNGSGSVIDSHTYKSPGVYTVTLTVSDATASGSSTFEYVSAYDPQPSSHFDAARLITSPSGAYSAGPSLTGQVQFGVSTRYSGSNPVGSVSLDFPAAKFKFASTSISSLVVATTKATLRGSGTVNGISGYKFLVTGLDGSGGNGKIRFQIKDGSGNVVYDTQPGTSDVTNPTTSVTGSVNVK